MPTPARVVVLPQEPGPLLLEDVELPDPGPHQVVVRQFATGVCHSQLHQMHNPRPSALLLGHESTGVVLAAGAEVRHVAEGDHVMVTWVPRSPEAAARRAEPTRIRRPDGTEAVTRNVFTWADHTLVDEQYVVALPAGARTDVTAIIGCAVMTGAGAVVHTARVGAGESVAVFGVGGVGLSAVAAARAVGADPVIAVDLQPDKLEFARSFGANVLVNAAEGDPVARIRELTRRDGGTDIAGQPIAGVDYAFDCIGVRATMEQIVPAVRSGAFGARRGGTAVLVGVPQTEVTLDARDVLVNEKRFIGSIGGSCRPDRDFPRFLDWHAEGRLDLDALVTARYPLDAIGEATAALERGEVTGRSIIDLTT